MPIIQSKFKPAWWLFNAHFQTFFPALFRKKPQLKRRRERINTPDHDFLDLDWVQNDQPAHSLVIIMHGLSGSSNSQYVLGLQNSLLQNQIDSVAINFRGCSGELNKKARAYHSGETGDFNFVLSHVRAIYPQYKIHAVGFSLGGNVLLKWLGEHSDHQLLTSAIAISAPMLLHECATRLDQGFARIYREYLLRPLKKMVHDKKLHLKKLKQWDELALLEKTGNLSAVQSFWQYDDQVVARLHGFASAADYYQKSSSQSFLASINSPTLIIHAQDDPFMNEKVIPSESQLTHHITLELSPHGGHVGFVAGNNPFHPKYWLESRIIDYLKDF